MQAEITDLLPSTTITTRQARPVAPSVDLSRLILSFHRDIRVEEEQDGIKLHMPLATQTLRGASPGMVAVVQMLAADGATEEALAELLLSIDANATFATFYYRIQQWKSWNALRYTLATEDSPLLTIEPMSEYVRFSAVQIDPATRYTLSRFALCRRIGTHLILESPLSHVRILLEGSAGAALIAALATPHSAEELSGQMDTLPEDVALTALSLLMQLSLIAPVDGQGIPQEEQNETLQQWNFHDLLFHGRSRVGRHDYPFGGRYRFLGKIEPQPAIKPRMSDDVIDLYRPDIEDLKLHDLPFTQVLEDRRSFREYGDPPISLQQLGEFLYRVARVRFIIPRYSSPGQVYEASNRPYPGGGAGYELEFYLTVNTCDGLESGIYHYHPLDHQLCKLAPRNAHVESLINAASVSAANLCVPQVLITLASRFQRMGWKYDSMAYAATLKNVGVLYQTMYLVATAMGLAPCGLGSGNSDLFAKAVGVDYLKESSVGEFMLGSRKV